MTSPCAGYAVSTPYGQPGSWAAGYHTGNDYAAPAGTTVVATRAGTVTKAMYDGDYGNRVEILTGDIEHSYSHLSVIAVGVGQSVNEGQRVGDVGSTGRSTGPHLHYEERHSPYGYNDDRAPQFDASGGSTPAEYPTPTSGTVYLSKLRHGCCDGGSDSVWYLQRALNNHPLQYGETLPLTGFFGDMTDEEVRLCQSQHGYGPGGAGSSDPPGTAYVGSSQASHLFAGSGLTIVDDR